MLVSVAHVQLAPLALPEVGKRAGPDSRLDDDQAVLLGTVRRVSHGIPGLVAVGAKDPGRVVALAGAVVGDGLETLFIRISGQQTIDFLLTILDIFTDRVARLVVAQDALRVVHPVGLVYHLINRGLGDALLGFLGHHCFNFERQLALLLTLRNFVLALRHQLGGVVDPGDLSTQVVLLCFDVEGIGHNLSVEVPGEADLDLACGCQI